MKTRSESGQTTQTTASAHGTCAWCRKDFASVADLVDHADDHS
jgi:hypothetical protein